MPWRRRIPTVREAANCNISVVSEWIVRTGMQLYREAQHEEPIGPMLKIDPRNLGS